MKLRGNILMGGKLALSVLRMNKYASPIAQAKASGDYDRERELIATACSEWVSKLMKSFDLTFDVSGRENIPDGPCVFIGDHQGYCDIIAMMKAVEGKQLGFIAREGFKPVPILSTWIERTRGLFIPTGTDTRESLRVINQGADLLKDGFSLMIFPEGKRNWGRGMGEFKAGSFKLATKAKVPIVPVSIDGTYHMFEEHEKITGGQTAKIIIHPPIETSSLSREEIKTLHTKVEEIVRSGLSKETGAPIEEIKKGAS